MTPEEDKTMQKAQELLMRARRVLKTNEDNLKLAISMLEQARLVVKAQMEAFAAYSLPVPPEMVVSALFDLQTALGGPDEPEKTTPKCPVEGEHEWKA